MERFAAEKKAPKQGKRRGRKPNQNKDSEKACCSKTVGVSPPGSSSEDSDDSVAKEYPKPQPLRKRVKGTVFPSSTFVIRRPATVAAPLTPASTTSSDSQRRTIEAIADDYVLLKWQPAGKKRVPVYYVCHVASHTPGSDVWTLHCMRRYRSATTQFVFPEQPDIGEYSAEDIVCVLPPPKCAANRSVHNFKFDFSPYLTLLR